MKFFGLGAALLAFVVVAHFGYMLSHDHPSAFLMGLVGGWIVYKFVEDKVKDKEEALDEPLAKLYQIGKSEAFATVKDFMGTIGVNDRFWQPQNLDSQAGTMLYRITYDEDYSTPNQRFVENRQIVFMASFNPEGPGTLVRLRFNVTSRFNRTTANQLVKSVSDGVHAELERVVADRRVRNE